MKKIIEFLQQQDVTFFGITCLLVSLLIAFYVNNALSEKDISKINKKKLNGICRTLIYISFSTAIIQLLLFFGKPEIPIFLIIHFYLLTVTIGFSYFVFTKEYKNKDGMYGFSRATFLSISLIIPVQLYVNTNLTVILISIFSLIISFLFMDYQRKKSQN